MISSTSCRYGILILICFAFSLGSCGTEYHKSHNSLNLLINKKGTVYLKRDGWNKFYSTSIGAILDFEDQIRLEDNSTATILCSNFSMWEAPANSRFAISNGCPRENGRQLLMRGGSIIGGPRSNNSPLIPFVILPRNTKVLSKRPTIRWYSVPNIKEYLVRIEGVDNWETTVTDSELVYPGFPPLEPGITYTVAVQTIDGRSSQAESETGTFTMLNAEEAKYIEEIQKQLKTLQLEDDINIFVLAMIYDNNGLTAEAIEMIQSLHEKGKGLANTYLQLGHMYSKTGVPFLAKDQFLEAIDMSRASGDLELRSNAELGLAVSYYDLGLKADALEILSDARNGFRTLGDRSSLQNVKALLEKWE